ncbi:DUF1641 domain-containing protein [Thermoplasma acidophilum]|nr:DUF1641 domain-containing protein [Thermoplasma acidophilum]MCY0851273.1 DUF1641 domain-containing protein [Thermoplasma acidophilum]
MAKKIDQVEMQESVQSEKEILEYLMDLASSLRSSGLLDMIKALADNKNDILSILSREAAEETNRRFLDNALIMYLFVSSLDTEMLTKITNGIIEAINGAKKQREHAGLSLMKINAMMKNPEVAAGLRVLFAIIGSLGGGNGGDGSK